MLRERAAGGVEADTIASADDDEMDQAWVATLEALAGEMAALRHRLAAAEHALGLPVAPGRPTPLPVPDLGRRLAALERRAGIIPGLDPLPGFATAAQPAGDVAPPPAPRVWLDRGQVLVAAALLVALLAWLLRPAPSRAPAGAPTPAPQAHPAATGRPVPAAPPVVVNPGGVHTVDVVLNANPMHVATPGSTAALVPADLIDWERCERTGVATDCQPAPPPPHRATPEEPLVPQR